MQSTFERRLEHGGGLGCQKDAAGVLVEGAALVAGHDQLSYKAGAIPDIVVLVVLAQVEDVLGEQLGLEKKSPPATAIFLFFFYKGTHSFVLCLTSSYLLGVGEVEFGRQVDGLQLDNVLLRCERFGDLAQHVGRNLGHALAVLAHEPQDAGASHGHLRETSREDRAARLFARGFNKSHPHGILL